MTCYRMSQKTLFWTIKHISCNEEEKKVHDKKSFPPVFPFWPFLAPPYFFQDASCVLLNMDWTPLLVIVGMVAVGVVTVGMATVGMVTVGMAAVGMMAVGMVTCTRDGLPVMDCILRRATQKNNCGKQRRGGKRIADLDFADDIALLDDT